MNFLGFVLVLSLPYTNGNYISISIVDPQPGARWNDELVIDIAVNAVDGEGLACEGCVEVDPLAQLCHFGGINIVCTSLFSSNKLLNVLVRHPTETKGVSEVKVWIESGSNGIISDTSIFIWESALDALEGLIDKLCCFEPNDGCSEAIIDPNGVISLHMGFAFSQIGKYGSALSAFARSMRFGSNSARYWTRALQSGMDIQEVVDIDFIEIGCSTFRTLTQSLPRESVARGLAVEPIQSYLRQMLLTSANGHASERVGLLNVFGQPFAVDETGGYDEDLYYLREQDVAHLLIGEAGDSSRFLTPELFGCNSLGAPHKTLQRQFAERGLKAPWHIEAVQVFTYDELLKQSPFMTGRKHLGVGLLKIDVEGKDLAVLRSVIDHCTNLGGVCPLAIQFESLEVYENQDELSSILGDLTNLGYHEINVGVGNDRYLSKKQSLMNTDEFNTSEVYTWSAPLGLLVGSISSCDSPVVSVPTSASVSLLSAGVPVTSCLLITGTNLSSRSIVSDMPS